MACNYLVGKGHHILNHNFSTHYGEIDIISMEGNTIVFTEVKYRNNLMYGFGEEAVTFVKQSRIQKAANYFLYKFHYYNYPCRFDVIAINNGSINHIINAFGGM